MPTSFDEIIDSGLTLIVDYQLDSLYNTDMNAFLKFCDSLVIKAIPKFKECNQDLEYEVDYTTDPYTREFTNTLTIYEKDILAEYWAIGWFTRELQVASRINAALQNSGSFKSHSEAQNLKAKESYLNGLRVKVKQDTVDYLVMYPSTYDY